MPLSFYICFAKPSLLRMTETILEILKYVLPSLIVFLTAFYLIKTFFNNELRKLEHRLRTETRKDTLPLRLQAYERLSLFMERISPANLILRVLQPGMTAQAFQQALIQTIRVEYEHNVSQQIYVSSAIWRSVSLVKDELIRNINLISAAVAPDAPAKDLSKKILEYYLESQEALPMQQVQDMIKQEVRRLF
ncbi:MAG: hypothetical protein KatS3mg031_1230 [Chitinophagales bacterium]|nr:MAG: hypothetical protein KatS3mg031_1230 [Chitinophagales bacterium]